MTGFVAAPGPLLGIPLTGDLDELRKGGFEANTAVGDGETRCSVIEPRRLKSTCFDGTCSANGLCTAQDPPNFVFTPDYPATLARSCKSPQRQNRPRPDGRVVLGPMKRLGSWLVVLALELVITTFVSGVAVAYVASFAGFGRLPDDPSPPPVTREALVLTLEWQKSAFTWTFWGLVSILGLVDLAFYFNSLSEPGRLVTFSAVAGSRARARLVKFLLIMTFVCAWATAWFTWLQDVTVPQGAWMHRLSWFTVAAAFMALYLALKSGSRWVWGCTMATAVALSSAVGLAALRGALAADVYLGGTALLWLLLDKGMRVPIETTMT